MFLKRSSVTTSGSLIDPSGTCTISSHSRRHRPPDGAFRSLLSNTRRRIKIGPSTSVSESSSSSSSEDSSQALNACLAYIVEDGDNQDLAFLLQVVTHGLRALTNCSTSTPHERMTGIPLHGQMSPRNLYEIRVIARKVVSSRFLPVDFIGLKLQVDSHSMPAISWVPGCVPDCTAGISSELISAAVHSNSTSAPMYFCR